MAESALRQYEYGGEGLFGFLMPERREILSPEQQLLQGYESTRRGPAAVIETIPARYGEPEVGFEYTPVVRGIRSALNAVQDLFTSPPTVEQAKEAGTSALRGIDQYMRDQATAGALGGTAYNPETGQITEFDPTVAMVGGAPAGVQAVRAATPGSVVLGMIGSKNAKFAPSELEAINKLDKAGWDTNQLFLHGTASDFEGQMKPSRFGDLGPGNYLTGSAFDESGDFNQFSFKDTLTTAPEMAGQYAVSRKYSKPDQRVNGAPNTRPMIIKKGLKFYDVTGGMGNDVLVGIPEQVKALKQQGFDGIRSIDPKTGNVIQMNVFDPENIRSAFDYSIPETTLRSGSKRGTGVAAVSALNDLDMSYDARMQRAADQEYGRDVYHGTLNEFDEFDPSEVDIGVHVGTYEQANNRLRDLYGESSGGSRFSGLYGDGANVMPLKAKIQNPLVMEDVGDWKNSYEVLVGLRNTPAFSHKAKIIEDMIQEADDLQSQFQYGEELWRDSIENREFLDEIRQMIKDEGYDSVQYANKVENQYSGESGFTRTADAMLRQKSQEISMLEQFVRDKMPQPPDPSDPLVNEKMRRFLDAKFEDYATTEELAQIEKLKNEYRAIANDPSSKNDINSYIVLDPENLRSINAKFDPREKGSSNILAGIAGGSLVGGSALSGRRQEKNN